MLLPKFAPPRTFHAELKRRTTQYFQTTGKAQTGNGALLGKALLLVGSLIALYIHLVFFTPLAAWAVLECVLMGTVLALIGFNVMHDGAHGSFSRHAWLNRFAAFTLNVLGAAATCGTPSTTRYTTCTPTSMASTMTSTSGPGCA
ncbi:hypothetical protein [Hymenobacter sp. BRD67]|uniref:hypothetical protein n=1 Tax=Hymenobacter sp. BRD67 TaxID=2675877 RepID=UPI00293BFB4A|nr:hypothetical protein [Hymenobacter sp. BRD67]